MASYSSVVSASGVTPSSRSRTATVARYWRIAPARSPPRASAAISRRRAGSSSGSSSTRRSAADIAVAVSPSASAADARRSSTWTTFRSTVTARVARQSSKSGESRIEKPARNGPRARAAAAASDREIRASGRPLLECGDIQPDAVAGTGQGDGRAVDVEPSVAEGRAQDRQRAPQGAASGLVVRLGPEHRRELVPGVRSTLHAEQRQDRRRLAGVDGQRLAVHADVEWAENADLQRHGA